MNGWIAAGAAFVGGLIVGKKLSPTNAPTYQVVWAEGGPDGIRDGTMFTTEADLIHALQREARSLKAERAESKRRGEPPNPLYKVQIRRLLDGKEARVEVHPNDEARTNWLKRFY